MREKKEGLLWQIFFVFIFLALGLYLLDRENLLQSTRSFFEKYFITSPSEEISEDSQNQIDQLNAKLISLEKQNSLLRSENEDLRKQLGAPLPPSVKFIPAKIISIKGENYEDEKIMIIKAGNDQDIEKDMPVVFENILLGRISNVGATISQTQLLTDPKSKIAVKTEKGVKGLLVGGKVQDEEDIFSFASMDSILQKDEVNEKDQILTSGEDGLPEDLLAGEVVSVISNEKDPFKSAKMKLLISPKELETVFVAIF